LLGPHGFRQLALALALATALGGCADDQGSDAGALDERTAARVTRHTDGDTLWLSGIGKVRLIGIDTPEVFGQAECYGRQASAFLSRLLPIGARVSYSLGVERRDRYGRALAYLYARDGRFVNLLLVRRGYAHPLTIPPNDRFAGRFVEAARSARARRVGMWARGVCV
jgi:endonuclease YncB( thermonuclease family)